MATESRQNTARSAEGAPLRERRTATEPAAPRLKVLARGAQTGSNAVHVVPVPDSVVQQPLCTATLVVK